MESGEPAQTQEVTSEKAGQEDVGRNDSTPHAIASLADSAQESSGEMKSLLNSELAPLAEVVESHLDKQEVDPTDQSTSEGAKATQVKTSHEEL